MTTEHDAYEAGARALYDESGDVDPTALAAVLASNPYDDEPAWKRIAREWQDSGRGMPLASLASGAWEPPLTEIQWEQMRLASATIDSSNPDYHLFRAWLYGPDAAERRHATVVL